MFDHSVCESKHWIESPLLSTWVRGTGILTVAALLSKPPLLPLLFPLKVLQHSPLAASWISHHMLNTLLVHLLAWSWPGLCRANNKFLPPEMATLLPLVWVWAVPSRKELMGSKASAPSFSTSSSSPSPLAGIWGCTGCQWYGAGGAGCLGVPATSLKLLSHHMQGQTVMSLSAPFGAKQIC